GAREAEGRWYAAPPWPRRGELLRHRRSRPLHQGGPPLPRRARRIGGADRAMTEIEHAAVRAPAGAAGLMDWWLLLRPTQWVKNLLIFAALIFSMHLLVAESVLRTLVAFVSFCLVASAAYIVNDVHDAERDRRHPIKSQRPIAAGR